MLVMTATDTTFFERDYATFVQMSKYDSFAILESDLSLLEAEGSATQKISKIEQDYTKRVYDILKKLDDDPEGTINSTEFANLIKTNEANSKIISAERAKLIGKTNAELQTTDKRIYDQFMAGKGTLLELFKKEYGKELSKFGKSITTGKVLIAFLLVNLAAMINGFFFTLFMLATGGNFYAASVGTAIIIAPLSEELLRMLNGNITHDHAFSDMINILEVIQYVGGTLAKGGLVAGIVVLLIRFFISMNIHKSASYNLLKDRITSLIGDKSAERLSDTNASIGVTTFNVVKHSLFNAISTINTLFAIIFGCVSNNLDYFFDVKSDAIPA